MLITQLEFCQKYNIDKTAFENTGLKWNDLTEIYDDYLNFKEELEPSAIFLFNSLMKARNVHSVRYRIKDPEHLIEKIIRKKLENPEAIINVGNYKEEVTDLIGLRALHLFKDDWETINDYIRELWNLKEKPVANYRNGDSKELIDFFIVKDCNTKEHKYGYRSVHYLIETQPAKQKFYAEIQVRTIFEEAWAEIDHTIRYPYDLDNIIFFQFLLILNRLAGSADEMGSYIQFLKKELSDKEVQFKNQIDEKSQIISDLESKIDKLNLQGEELEAVKGDLERLKKQKLSGSYFEGINLRVISDLGSFNPSENLMDWRDNINKLQNSMNLNTFTGIDSDLTYQSPQELSDFSIEMPEVTIKKKKTKTKE